MPKNMSVEFATDPLIPFVPTPQPQFNDAQGLAPDLEARIRNAYDDEVTRWRTAEDEAQQASERSRRRFWVSGTFEGTEDGRVEFSGHIPDPSTNRLSPGQTQDDCMLHKGIYRILSAHAEAPDGATVPVSAIPVIEIEIDQDYNCLPESPIGSLGDLEIEPPAAGK